MRVLVDRKVARDRRALADYRIDAHLAAVQLELPRHPSLSEVRDGLSSGQAQLLGYLVQQCGQGSEILQREIERAMGPHVGPELFYRLETLIAQGFITKRRVSTDGQFSYRLTPEFVQRVKK